MFTLCSGKATFFIISYNYPCLCLCLGFSQITLITPFLLITIHLSHIFFTDGLTFISFTPLFITILSIFYFKQIKSSILCIFINWLGWRRTLCTSKSNRFMKMCKILPFICFITLVTRLSYLVFAPMRCIVCITKLFLFCSPSNSTSI